MFPLKTLPNARNTPYLTWVLVLVNALAFAYQLAAHYLARVDLAVIWGIRPGCYLAPQSCGVGTQNAGELLGQPLVVAPFLHGDFWHLVFNLWFLWVFGGGVEDKIGKWRFALLYCGGALAASLAQILSSPLSFVPIIGASGAIAAVLGAYFVAQPKGWVLSYFPPIFFFPVPAPLFLIVWAVAQIWGALNNFSWLGASQSGGIAWMAHVGGFAAGALYGWKLVPWWKATKTAQ